MSRTLDEQGRKPVALSGRTPHEHHPDAYAAEIVSPRQAWALVHETAGQTGVLTADQAAAWVAERQLGVVTFQQLELVGVGRGRIASYARRGLLRRVHIGVYLLGHPNPVPGALELAGVLACGDGTFASHGSAMALYGLAERPPEVHVTVVGRHCRTRPNLCVHSTRDIHPRDREIRNGIPVTAPARAVLDCAASYTPDELERILAEGYARRLFTEKDLQAVIDRAPHRAGVAVLRAELRRETGPRRTNSYGERRMLRLIRRAGLPVPLTNARVEGYRADFLWPDHKLIVEIDGYQFHNHRWAFERDRRRDAAHVAAGYRIIRVTMRRLEEEPLAVAVTIARALEVCRRD